MSTKNLSVQYHQQDTDYYCGAACAQMVLAEIGAGILDQDTLYNDNHSHSTTESGWATGPDGLQWTLNNLQPSPHTKYFCLDALSSEDQISRMIIWTIYHWNVAPVALVYGSQHWIVVRGYDTSADPNNSIDNSYSINGFDVNNPWPPTPSPGVPPPHSFGDICGSGGVRGVANEHISYSTWQADYMTGATGGYWNGKFVAICDPPPPGQLIGKSVHQNALFNGERIISKEEAIRSVESGLNHHRMYEKELWADCFIKTRIGEPVLVQRLDRLDSYYYILPYNTVKDASASMVSIDAKTGVYKQAIKLPEPSNHLSTAYNRKELSASVVNKRFELANQTGKLIIRPEAYCLYPTLVWKPCLESMSPFWPFHMYTIGAQHVYVRIDGAIFTQLHDMYKGL
jgi:hypothetical protein